VTFAPVGLRCPDHAAVSGSPPRRRQKAAGRPRVSVARPRVRPGLTPVTRVLVAVNVLIYLAELGSGAGVNADSGWIFAHGTLIGGPTIIDGAFYEGVAGGEWWRLITAAFLHYGPIHLGFNMLALWWLGGAVEAAIGSWRFLLLYLVSGLAGSAGALLLTPTGVTVGASGAIFGMLGAGLILEYLATGTLAGQFLSLIAINLVLSIALAGRISLGGHLGGLVGGILAMLVLTKFGRGSARYGPIGAVGIAGVVAIGVASVLIAYWKVRGLA
jgi:membrane associated rhomboid family serine protease